MPTASLLGWIGTGITVGSILLVLFRSVTEDLDVWEKYVGRRTPGWPKLTSITDEYPE